MAEAGLLDQEADTIVDSRPLRHPAVNCGVAPWSLHGAIVGAMGQPDATEKLAALGFEAIASTPEEFAARIATDIPKWANVIRGGQYQGRVGVMTSV